MCVLWCIHIVLCRHKMLECAVTFHHVRLFVSASVERRDEISIVWTSEKDSIRRKGHLMSYLVSFVQPLHDWCIRNTFCFVGMEDTRINAAFFRVWIWWHDRFNGAFRVRSHFRFCKSWSRNHIPTLFLTLKLLSQAEIPRNGGNDIFHEKHLLGLQIVEAIL